jgi:glycosyltransferase involved in cell wall biosynthesis
VGALPEMLDGGSAGLLIDAGDWEALGHSINRFLDDPSFAAEIGSAAGHRARDLWDVKCVAKRVEAVYREVLPIDRIEATSSLAFIPWD